MQKNKLVVLNLFKFLDKQDYSTIEPYLGGIQRIVHMILKHDAQNNKNQKNQKKNQELYNKFELLPPEDRNQFLNPKKICDVANVLETIKGKSTSTESKIKCEFELNKIEGEPEPKKSEIENCLNINNIGNNNIGNNNISGNNLLKEEGLKETNERKTSFDNNKAYHEKQSNNINKGMEK